LKNGKLRDRTVGLHVRPIGFFFVRGHENAALKRELPTPKRHRRLPTDWQSQEEVGRLIAGEKTIYQRTML